MDRRGIGLMVVVFALMAAVIVPNAFGRTIPGVAEAVSVPGPPTVGDCVTESFDPTPAVTSSADTTIAYPSLTIAPCTGVRFGEVVAVISHPAGPTFPIDSDGNKMIADPNESKTCFPATERYIGIPGVGSVDQLTDRYWWLIIRSGDVLSEPSLRQRAAGQHWLACIAYLPISTEAGGFGVQSSRGSLKGAISTGVGRDYLGVCLATADWEDARLDNCFAPHESEVFGSGAVTDTPVARSDLESTCRSLIQQVTGMTDVTDDGRLAVQMLATDMEGHRLANKMIPADSPVQCGITTVGGKALNGSLLGIWNDRIPWA